MMSSAVLNDLLQVRVIDVVKYRKVHEEVMKKLDKLENEFLPQVTVDNTEIIFDIVRYLEPQSQELIIANTGQVSPIYCTTAKWKEISYLSLLKLTLFSEKNYIRCLCSLNLSRN